MFPDVALEAFCCLYCLTSMGAGPRNTVIVGDLNTPVISMDRSSRQKINKEIQAVNDTLDQMNFIVLYL